MAITQLQLSGIGGRRYGSFAGKTASTPIPKGDVNVIDLAVFNLSVVDFPANNLAVTDSSANTLEVEDFTQ